MNTHSGKFVKNVVRKPAKLAQQDTHLRINTPNTDVRSGSAAKMKTRLGVNVWRE